ncbi:hypothetical protein KY285_004329 [Solanum tuberosum]|nr:hypothetical protein KY285_004329 [Solanum tuberosum]
MKRFFSPISSKLPQSSSSAQNAPRVEENLNQLEETHHSAKRLKQRVDLDSLPADPKKRIPIRDYYPDERDEIRRAYIQRDENIHQGGGETFSSIGFRSWHKKKRLDTPIGKSNSVHNQAKKKCEDLMRQEQSIQATFVKLSNQTKLEHKIHLKASIEVARLLLNQGLTFRGHREDESSLNKGNFLEILSWHAKRCDKIGELVLKKAPKNDQMTSHKIQRDIVTAWQCYDGASNMQGLLSGLKVLIQQEMGGSFKRMDELRESQEKKVPVALDMGEVESEKAKATGYFKVCQTFEIAFILHLMRDILAITNELNESLQKKEQDIANAILLVKVVKKRLQDLRNEGWDSLAENVSAFCVKYDILIPNFDEFYVNFGRSQRKVAKNQLETYIVDVRDVDKRFSNLKGLGDLSEMLVKLKELSRQ